MKLNFSKYHGAGNDFVIIDNRFLNLSLSHEAIRFMCDRHFGIGADGLMLLENDEKFDFHMRYFNSDGNESTMCGNGGRCIVMFARRLGIISDTTIFRGVDGEHDATIKGSEVKLRMIDVVHIETIDDYYFINTGSPHLVKFVSDTGSIDVETEGRLLSRAFNSQQGGTNVNFVQIMPDTLRIRTYERGVEAETLACGTGSVASAIAVNHWLSEEKNEYKILAKGGKLRVWFKKEERIYSNVHLEGPAQHVFDGTIELLKRAQFLLNDTLNPVTENLLT